MPQQVKQIMEQFHFLRPDWLWALIPLTIVLLIWVRQKGRSRSWQGYCDAELLPFLMVGSEAGRSYNMVLVGGLAGLLTIIALAGPTWEMRPQPLFRSQSAMVIALDLSLSMNATDIRPNRLGRAKLKLRDILERRKEGQTGLLVFAAEPFVVTPLTTDTATITALLNPIDTSLLPVEAQGSHPEKALTKAVELLQQAGAVQGDILLITDGVVPNCGEPCIEAAEQVKGAGFRLSIISVGSSDGAPIPTANGYLKDGDGTIVIPKLDEVMLREMARRGGGRFSPLRSDDSDLDVVLSLASSAASIGSKQAIDAESQQWYESGPWLLLVLLPLVALFYRRGILVIPLMLLLHSNGEVMADEGIGSKLWKNDNQRAEQLLEAGRFDEAAKLFNNKQWQAAAQYRAGHYEKAAKLLEGEPDITSQYNYANAQAKMGKFPEALKSYESVLERAPDYEDARHNLELVKKKMQQQQEQQKQGDGSGEQQQKSSDGGDESKNPKEGSSDGEEGDSKKQGQQDQQGQQASPSDTEEGKQEGEEPSPAHSDATDKPEEGAESQQAMAQSQPQGEASEQWLRQIPDDPGGLLQRKFRYQYQQSYQGRERERQPW